MKIFIISFSFVIISSVAQSWTRLPGAAKEISAKGNELWMIDSAQNINRWNGSSWQVKPGKAVRVGASPDGWTWILDSTGKVYRWNTIIANWERMPGTLAQINAISKDKAVGVNSAGSIFLWQNGNWTLQPGAGAAVGASIGDGGERWITNNAQQIFRWNQSTNKWDRMPGSGVNIDVQNSTRVIMADKTMKISVWKNNSWQFLSGTGATGIKSTINGANYFTVNNVQQIFRGQ